MLTANLCVAGGMLVVIGAMNIGLPSVLGWATDFASVSPLNRQIVRVHSVFIAFTCAMLGTIALTAALAPAAATGPFAAVTFLLMAGFFGTRLVIQFVGFDPALWRGNTARTVLHVLFVLGWTYFTVVFAWAALGAAGAVSSGA